MPDGPVISFIIILVLIIINAFFASAEMAVVSLNKTKINLLAEDGNKKALLIKKLLNNPSDFLATIQVGITLAQLFAAASAATSISAYLAKFLKKANIPYFNSISLIIVTMLISYLTLVLGELFPKRLALKNADTVALKIVSPLISISKLAKPFVWLLSCSTNILLKLCGIKTSEDNQSVSREEIISLIAIGEETGVISESEREMIDSIIKFDNTLAREIMIPRTETSSIEVNTAINDVLDLIQKKGYSRIPVYDTNIDNIVGILHTKDILNNIRRLGLEKITVFDIMRNPCFIPETNNIEDVFKKLKSTKNHIAILIDEYGGFSGIVTLEDIIEEVMGDITDEFDVESKVIEKIDENNYVVNGLITIDNFNDEFDLDLNSKYTDTIGGFFLEHLGSFPKEDEYPEIEVGRVIFKLLKLDEKRIDCLYVTFID